MIPARIFVLCLLVCCALPVLPAAARDPCEELMYPSVTFDYQVDESETFPVVVHFQGTTRSQKIVDSWRWSFGDGTVTTVIRGDTSTTNSPVHSFTTLKDHYDVCFRATTICGLTDEECKEIPAYCVRPRAGYSADTYEGAAPLAVRFTDTSTHSPQDATTWDYTKNGSTISVQRNFAGTFTSPGVYAVTQTVKKNCHPSADSFSHIIRVNQPIGVVSVMNLSFPTTTPTIAVVQWYANFSGVTVATTVPSAGTAATTSVPATTTVPVTAGAAVPGTTPRGPGAATVPAAAAGPAVFAGTDPGTGTLAVASSPAGAEVYVDNVLRGASPVAIPGLPAGTHVLRLEQDGYQTMAVPVEIPAGTTTEYSTALVPVSGGIGVMPLLAVSFGILALAGAGAYVYVKRRRQA